NPKDRRRLEREWLDVRMNVFELANVPDDTAWFIEWFTKYTEFWTRAYNDLQIVYGNCSNRADDPKTKLRWKMRQQIILEHIKELEKLPETLNLYLQDS